MYDVIIIGCGVTGAALANRLSRLNLKTAVLEQNSDIACGCTKSNSAIIHAGYDPEPGTLMARLNVAGNKDMDDLCRRLSVPFIRTGSLVTAFSPEEIPVLKALLQRGSANGVPGLRILDKEEIHRMEPALAQNAVAALFAPTAGITDPWELTLALAENAVANGVELYRNTTVTAIEPADKGFTVKSGRKEWLTRRICNAAGLYADAVHRLLEPVDWKIIPVRGEYFLFDKNQRPLVNHIIFQCPTPQGKGVLVAPTVHGNLLAGPNAETVSCKEDTSTTATGQDFVRHSAQKILPSLNFKENIRNFAGIRANNTRNDFIIEESLQFPGFFDIAGIKSPGLSCALSIAAYAEDMMAAAGLPQEEKDTVIETRNRIVFRNLSLEEQQKLMQHDSRYGQIICRCETVTEGEITAALHSPVPAVSINGIKRRCGAGMGRCQGGFCSPRVQEIIARELHIPLESVPLEEPDSWILADSLQSRERNV